MTDKSATPQADYKRAKILTKPLPQILDEMESNITAAAAISVASLFMVRYAGPSA